MAFWLARHLAFDEQQLRAGLRRALLVRAAGGDPHRDLVPDDVAVGRLAEELDWPGRRAAVEQELGRLEAATGGRGAVGAAISTLRADGDVAWRWVALALLADELSEEDRPSG